MLKWEIIFPPGTRLYRCSVSVSGAAFKLHSHILMLSEARIGLTVSLDSVGETKLGIEGSGYDDND